MKRKYIRLLAVFLLLNIANSCSQAQQDTQLNLSADIDHEKFGDYWYQGEAELNNFKIEEIRYGEIREGSAVMIFVTEDFLTDKQVKLETAPAGRDHTTVLKLNYMEEFTTGIYEYNMMASVFSPVQVHKYPQTQKVTISSQDWCGHAFFQLNNNGKGFDLMGHSYFESEGDFSQTLPNVITEDDIWVKLRLNPDLLPEGEIQLIPGGFYQRFSHRDWAPATATTEHMAWENNDDTFPGNNLMAYEISYPNLNRTLTIIYEAEAPYKIAGWIKEREGSDGETLTATSIRTNSIKSAYWRQHDNDDLNMRDSLGLSRTNLNAKVND